MQAFLAAQNEANAFIAADPEAAVAAYGRITRLSVPHDQLMEVLKGGEEGFSTVPDVLKSKVGGWQELFLPSLLDRTGS